MMQDNSKATEPSLETLRSFRRDLRSLEREIALALEAQTDCCGVTTAQCHLLLEVAFHGKASIGEAAAALEVDASSLSRTADSLVKAGYLAREDDPDNRRRQILSLTAKGQAKVDEIDERCDAYYSSALAPMRETERKALLESLPILASLLKCERTSQPACCGGRGKA
jgi:DNA-binding MarR family transcriptional regulator